MARAATEPPIRGNLAFEAAISRGLEQADPDPTVEEIIRNYPIRQPLLWVSQGARS